MNEEEKKAIKVLKINPEIIADLDEELLYKMFEFEGQSIKELKKWAYKIVLNLITKLQKENEELRDKKQDLLRKLRNRVKEVKKLAKYSLYKKEFSRLNKTIKEKDKQIDLMAEKINEAYFEENDFFDWFEKISGIRPKGNYKDEIKQYFETKAKKGE